MRSESQPMLPFGIHPHDRVSDAPWMAADARRDAHAKPTQRDRVLDLLREANGEWVSLTRILELRIAQFGARILELRRAGYNIENRTEEVAGETHSWYRLVRGNGAGA